MSVEMLPFSEVGCAAGDFGDGPGEAGIAVLRGNATLYEKSSPGDDAQYQGDAIRSQFQRVYMASGADNDLLCELPESLAMFEDVLGWSLRVDDKAIKRLLTVLNAQHDVATGRLVDGKRSIVDKAVQDLRLLEYFYPSGDRVGDACESSLSRLGFVSLNVFEVGRYMGAAGLCYITEDGSTAIGLHEGFDANVADDQRVVRHEALHAAFADMKAGFYYGVSGKKGSGFLEEVGVEHQARALTTDRFRNMDPGENLSQGAYQDRLTLVAALLNLPDNPVSHELFAEAIASPRAQNRGRSSARVALRASLNRAMDELLPEVEGGIMGLSDQFEAAGLSKRYDLLRNWTHSVLLRAGLEEMHEDIAPGTDAPYIITPV